MLARVSEAELGENSHKGYFAGVRTADNSLVLGAYDFAYHEAAKVPLPDPVRPFRWYHVKLRAVGCRITAFAWPDGMREVQTAPVNDPDCFRSGQHRPPVQRYGRRLAKCRGDTGQHVRCGARAVQHLPLPDATAFQRALLQMRVQRMEHKRLAKRRHRCRPNLCARYCTCRRLDRRWPRFAAPWFLPGRRSTCRTLRAGGVEVQSDNANSAQDRRRSRSHRRDQPR